jgi:hypothetical protein
LLEFLLELYAVMLHFGCTREFCNDAMLCFELCQGELMYIGDLWFRYKDIVNSLAKLNISGLPTLLTSEKCTDRSKLFDNFTTDVNNFFHEFYDELDTSKLSSLNIDTFTTASNIVQQQLVEMSTCMIDYQTLLDNINSWLDEVTASLSGQMELLDLYSASDLLSTLDDECTTLGDYLRLNSATSLQHLVDQIGQMYDTPLSLDDVDSAIFSKLTAIVDDLQTSVKGIYQELFAEFGKINLHMKNNDKLVDRFLRRLAIWRYPYVNLENQQV